MGLPCRSSAKIHPTDHMSTAGVYLVEPISSSGGLIREKSRVEHLRISELNKNAVGHLELRNK
jgi:hypothetical protein